MSDDTGVVGEVVRDEDRESLKGLRQEVGHGEIEGHEYSITQRISTATFIVEFEDVSVQYSVSDVVEDAYERALLGNDESGGDARD